MSKIIAYILLSYISNAGAQFILAAQKVALEGNKNAISKRFELGWTALVVYELQMLIGLINN